MSKIKTIEDVAARHLCAGCGACAYIAPASYEMVDDLDHGRRPIRIGPGSPSSDEEDAALSVCPGVDLTHCEETLPPNLLPELRAGWGPVIEVWEGHASDADVRFSGSSGGAATALCLFGVEEASLAGALHIAARPDAPILNHTVLSRTREQLLRGTGSRYAPASPCDGLSLIEEAAGPCIMVGKPCDIAAAQKARRIRPDLDRNLAITVGIFCAGAPSTRGTLAMLQRLEVGAVETVKEVRYRGNGWPGRATVTTGENGNGLRERSLSYHESWGDVLQRFRPWRCRICPDHTGEFADISVGDPWYRTPAPGEMGSSLVVVRTERGRRFLERAVASGLLTLEKVKPDLLPRSQPNLLGGRGAVWGRIWAMRLTGFPTPRFRGMPMFRFWWRELSLGEKIQSFAGTVRRILMRGMHKRVVINELDPESLRDRQPRSKV